MTFTIGVDVGGTKVAAGVVDEEGKVLVSTRRPTPSESPGAVEETIAAVITELRREYEVEAVGLGAAGFVDVQPVYGARLLALGGGEPEGIEAFEVTQAAREGDPAAVACFAEIGTWLGQGLANLAAVLDPAVFVIGGGVADAGELLLGPAR